MNWSSFCLGVLAASVYFGLPFWLALPCMVLVAVLPEILVPVLFPSAAKHGGARRKMMSASWSDPSDPSVQAELNLDATKIPSFLEAQSKATGEKLTVTHLVLKALAVTLRDAVNLRGRLVFSHFVPYPSVDVSCLVVMEKTNNLATVTVRNCDKKSLAEIAGQVKGSAKSLRDEKDKDFQKTVKTQASLPVCMLRSVAWMAGYLANSFGIDVAFLGASRFHFGCCIVTALGSIGLEKAMVPLTPFARVPLLVSVGLMAMQPAVVGEGESAKVVPRLTLPLTVTLDHRFVDGAHTLRMAKDLRRLIENPEELLAAEKK
mmetsp:Transcript_6470/g.14735  ORF Transcript_6470/g.14735 Transcript_6470/m.14735 type:complete len:318 (+) Transcript_6470:41-994(+)